MNDLPLYILAFGGVLGVLIVVHELGHYLAAKWCGVKVLRFSVGFGRILWSRRFGQDGTEWVVSAFPLGGYVKMLDEREGDVPAEEAHRAFNRQGVGRRSLIVAAGPAANFVLAIAIYWIVFFAGSEELLPVLGTPPSGTPAAEAGVRNGEQVRRVDGEAPATWSDLRWLLTQKAVGQERVTLEVIDQHGDIAVRQLALRTAGENGWEGDPVERLGIVFFKPQTPPVIGKVLPGSPGEVAGLRPGDRVLAIDGRPVSLWMDFVAVVRDSVSRALRLEVDRGGQVFVAELVPEAVPERGRTVGKVGVAVADTGEGLPKLRAYVRHGFLESGRRALVETWEKSWFSLVMMGRMLTGEVSWRNLSGPVTIADYAGQSARLGIDYYLRFMALISISLGVLNLLPIPLLDGGHLLYHMIEVVRRRPLSERAMGIGQQIGMSILFALMAFAFFNDLNRLFNG